MLSRSIVAVVFVAVLFVAMSSMLFMQSVAAQEDVDAKLVVKAEAEKQTQLQVAVTEKIATFDASMKEFQKASSAADSSEARKAAAELRPDVESLSQELLDIATKNPADPAAVDCVRWILQFNSRSQLALDAIALTREKMLANEKVHEVISALVQVGTVDERIAAFKQVLSENKNRLSRGLSTLALGVLHEELNGGSQGSSKKGTGIDEAIRYYQLAMKDYADVKFTEKESVGDIVGPMLFALEHLRVGTDAPDIVNEDLDGDSFKLSEYRGKVVVLDFWGHW